MGIDMELIADKMLDAFNRYRAVCGLHDNRKPRVRLDADAARGRA